MSQTLKQILDQVNSEIGFDLPSSYIGNTDPNIIQLVALANGLAIELRDLRLQKLIRQAFISLGSGGTVDLAENPQGNISYWPFPVDFYAATPNTVYQNGRIDMALWPTPSDAWAYLISRVGPQGLRIYVRTIQNRIYIFNPDASQTLQFEYISKYPVTAITPNTGVPSLTNQTPSETFTTDADVWELDDRLLVLYLKVAYKEEKGLNNTRDEERRRVYENELRSRDQNATTIRPPYPYPWQGEPYANLWVPTT
jgi:hypothetical protein